MRPAESATSDKRMRQDAQDKPDMNDASPDQGGVRRTAKPSNAGGP